MTEQEWWQRKIQRETSPPRQWAALSPSMLTGEHAAVQPIMDEPKHTSPTMNGQPPPIDAAQSQSPSGGRNGGFTPEVLQRMFDAEQEAKNRQYPAPRYHPNGIRVTAWDERGPDGDPIGGETSDIERSTLNPNYNPAYDTRGTGLPVQPQTDASAEDMPPRISQNDLDYNQLQSPPKKEKLWKDILYVAGQAAANIFDTRGDYQPIERLGETQKRRKDAAATQRIQVRNARQKFESDQAAAQRKGQMDALEYGLKLTKEQRDEMGADLVVKQVFESNQVTPEQAAYLNKKYGQSLTPGYWGKFVQEQIGGKNFIRRETSPNSVPDTSLPDNPTQYPLGTALPGGQTGYLPSGEAVKEANDLAEFNATQAIGIAKENTNNRIEIDKANVTNAMKFSDDVRQTLTTIANTNAAIMIAQPQLAGFASRMQIAAERAKVAAEKNDAESFDAAQQAFNVAQSDFYGALGQVQGGASLVQQLKDVMPKPPPRIKYRDIPAANTGTPQGGGQPGVMSKDRLQRIANDDTYQHMKDPKARLKQARADAEAAGWKIQ